MVRVKFDETRADNKTGYALWRFQSIKGLYDLISRTQDISAVRSIKEEIKTCHVKVQVKNEVARRCNAKIQEMELAPRTTWTYQFGMSYLYQRLRRLGANVDEIAKWNLSERQLTGFVAGLEYLRKTYHALTSSTMAKVEQKLYELQHKRQVRSTELAEQAVGQRAHELECECQDCQIHDADFWSKVDEIEATDDLCVRWSEAEKALGEFLKNAFVLEVAH